MVNKLHEMFHATLRGTNVKVRIVMRGISRNRESELFAGSC